MRSRAHVTPAPLRAAPVLAADAAGSGCRFCRVVLASTLLGPAVAGRAALLPAAGKNHPYHCSVQWDNEPGPKRRHSRCMDTMMEGYTGSEGILTRTAKVTGTCVAAGARVAAGSGWRRGRSCVVPIIGRRRDEACGGQQRASWRAAIGRRGRRAVADERGQRCGEVRTLRREPLGGGLCRRLGTLAAAVVWPE